MNNSEINFSTQKELTRTDGIIRSYQGYFKDEKKLLKSSSGGIATAVSEKIINLGGVVYGVVYSDDFKSAHYSCAKTIQELDSFKGSKYVKAHLQCEGVSVFKSVKEKLDKGIIVLFIGVPCAVVGMRSYLKKKYDNLFLVDLICYGPTLDIVQEQFINDLEKFNSSKIIDFTVRYKKEGWVPAYIKAVFENGEIYENLFYESDLGISFNLFTHPSCRNCKGKGINHRSDITLGDFWGLDKDSETYNKNGVSIAFIRTSVGENLICNLKDIKLEKADTDFAVSGNPYLNNQRKLNLNNQKKFERLIKLKGLHYACVHSISVRKKVKRFLKKVTPYFIFCFLKKGKKYYYLRINHKMKKQG